MGQLQRNYNSFQDEHAFFYFKTLPRISEITKLSLIRSFIVFLPQNISLLVLSADCSNYFVCLLIMYHDVAFYEWEQKHLVKFSC